MDEPGWVNGTENLENVRLSVDNPFKGKQNIWSRPQQSRSGNRQKQQIKSWNNSQTSWERPPGQQHIKIHDEVNLGEDYQPSMQLTQIKDCFETFK
jgi:hypothetical protein